MCGLVLHTDWGRIMCGLVLHTNWGRIMCGLVLHTNWARIMCGLVLLGQDNVLFSVEYRLRLDHSYSIILSVKLHYTLGLIILPTQLGLEPELLN